MSDATSATFRPGELVLAGAVMGECPLVSPRYMSVNLGLEIEGLRISHSPELTARRVCEVIDIDSRPWDSPLARSARYRDSKHSHAWECVDIELEAWRHSILCRLMVQLTRAELLSVGVPSLDHYLYRGIYLRYAPSELIPINQARIS